ncbi:MAG: HutD/Ves family protein [Steroidobacteraceae bacterium]
MTLQIIRKSSLTAAPWKNGGGITYEVLRVPAGGDPFRWRLSVAHIEASGPFSDFAGYDRKMVLLEGAGVELRFGDGVTKTLRRVGDLAEFDGAVSTYCELLNGPCVDLNLMVAKADGAAVRVEHLIESLEASVPRNETKLIFPIDRAIHLAVANGKTVTLEPWDLALMSHCSGHLSRLEPAGSALSSAVFLATLSKFVGGE